MTHKSECAYLVYVMRVFVCVCAVIDRTLCFIYESAEVLGGGGAADRAGWWEFTYWCSLFNGILSQSACICVPTCACVGIIRFLKGFKGQQEANGFPIAGSILRLLHRSPPVFISPPYLPIVLMRRCHLFSHSCFILLSVFRTSVPASFNLFLSFVGLEESRLMPVVSSALIPL